MSLKEVNITDIDWNTACVSSELSPVAITSDVIFETTFCENGISKNSTRFRIFLEFWNVNTLRSSPLWCHPCYHHIVHNHHSQHIVIIGSVWKAATLDSLSSLQETWQQSEMCSIIHPSHNMDKTIIIEWKMTRDYIRNCHTEIIHSTKQTRHHWENAITNLNWTNKQKTNLQEDRRLF